MDYLRTPSYSRDFFKSAELETSLGEKNLNLWNKETPKLYPSLSELERFKQELKMIEKKYQGVYKNELYQQIEDIQSEAMAAKREYQNTVEHHIDSSNFLIQQLSDKDNIIGQNMKEVSQLNERIKELEMENQALQSDKQSILNSYVIIKEENQKLHSQVLDEQERSQQQIQLFSTNNNQALQENVKLEIKVKQLTEKLEQMKQKEHENQKKQLLEAQK